MTPSRPYLLRALYEWILDNDTTPHILVNALHHDAHVPQEYVKDGQIVLNIAPGAVQTLSLDNDEVTFSARFQGVPNNVSVAMEAVLGIYAKENGKGMMFEAGSDYPPVDPSPFDPSGSPPLDKSKSVKKSGDVVIKRPSLRVVK